MELTKVQQYKMMDSKTLPNLKDIGGETIKVVACLTHTYVDSEGEEHKVLSLMCEDGRMFRTEVKAFIDSFVNYWAVFGEEADEDKPTMKIITMKSKRGNPYVSFELNT